MTDLEKLLEDRKQDWATPQKKSSQQSTNDTIPEEAPPTAPPDAPPPEPAQPPEGDRITALLTELDTLPPHNSKLTKFIMRLEPQLAAKLKTFCDHSNPKFTPEMFVEAVLLLLEGDETLKTALSDETDSDLAELLTSKRKDLREIIGKVSQKRAERRSRAGVIRRTLSMAGVTFPQ